MIRAVLLDLGKVIVPFDFDRAWRRVEALGGLSAVRIQENPAAVRLIQEFECGAISVPNFVKEMSIICRIEVQFDLFSELWNSIFLPKTLLSAELVEGLGARNPLILLSNTNPLHFEFLRANYPLLMHFHHYTLSFEAGAMKPSPEIYRRAVAAAGCRPEECFFTDDIPAYVQGARDFGIDAVQFTGQEQLERELLLRGVEWGPARG